MSENCHRVHEAGINKPRVLYTVSDSSIAFLESDAESICERSFAYMRSMSSSRPCVSHAAFDVSESFVKNICELCLVRAADRNLETDVLGLKGRGVRNEHSDCA